MRQPKTSIASVTLLTFAVLCGIFLIVFVGERTPRVPWMTAKTTVPALRITGTGHFSLLHVDVCFNSKCRLLNYEDFASVTDDATKCYRSGVTAEIMLLFATLTALTSYTLLLLQMRRRVLVRSDSKLSGMPMATTTLLSLSVVLFVVAPLQWMSYCGKPLRHGLSAESASYSTGVGLSFIAALLTAIAAVIEGVKPTGPAIDEIDYAAPISGASQALATGEYAAV